MSDRFKVLGEQGAGARVRWHFQDTETGSYYIVDRAPTFDRGDETMIFAADENGDITSWGDLYAGYGMDPATALEAFALILDGENKYDPSENIKLHGNPDSPLDGLFLSLINLVEDADTE